MLLAMIQCVISKNGGLEYLVVGYQRLDPFGYSGMCVYFAGTEADDL